MSVLFVSDTLINDLTDLIACHWLISQKCVQIWLLARELGLATLRDLAKATCVDRLRDVPESLLLELPGVDFVELVGNIHVKFSSTFPSELLQRWVDRNVPPGESNVFESQYPFTLLQDHISHDSSEVQKMFDDQYWKQNIQCIVGQKTLTYHHILKCIYAWDGTTFSEIIDLTSSSPFNTTLVRGLKAVGRGFDIYLVGGEYESDSRRHFQMEIWRYSLISKTWYYVTSMPRSHQELPFCDMMVIFGNEKLFLMSEERVDDPKPDCPHVFIADMYNIHTGQWNELPDLEGLVWEFSFLFERQGSLSVLTEDAIFSYDEDKDSWSYIDCIFQSVKSTVDYGRYIFPELFMTHGNYIYIVGTYKKDDIKRIFSVKDLEPSPTYITHPLYIGDCSLFYHQVANGPYLVSFGMKEHTLCVEVIKMIDGRSLELKTVYKDENKGVCAGIIDCFNIHNPSSLNELFVLEKEAK